MLRKFETYRTTRKKEQPMKSANNLPTLTSLSRNRDYEIYQKSNLLRDTNESKFIDHILKGQGIMEKYKISI